MQSSPSSILTDLARTDALLCLEMYKHGRSLHRITRLEDDYREGTCCPLSLGRANLRHTVERVFAKGWLHPNKAIPKVVSIFRILSPAKSIGRYATYRSLYSLRMVPVVDAKQIPGCAQARSGNQHDRTSTLPRNIPKVPPRREQG